MGDNAENRDGPESGSSGGDSGPVNDPLPQTGVKASRAAFNGRNPE